MLPSGMNTPWAGSDRYKDFGAQYHSGRESYPPTFHPHYLSVYASTSDFGETALYAGCNTRYRACG